MCLNMYIVGINVFKGSFLRLLKICVDSDMYITLHKLCKRFILDSTFFNFHFQVIYQSKQESIPPQIQVVNSSGTFSVDLANLRKFVEYEVQVQAYTRMGDGVLSSPPVSVQTFEDGE